MPAPVDWEWPPEELCWEEPGGLIWAHDSGGRREKIRRGADWCTPLTKMQFLPQASASLWTGQCFLFFQGLVFQIGLWKGICQPVSQKGKYPHLLRGWVGVPALKTLVALLSKCVPSTCPQVTCILKEKSASWVTLCAFVSHALLWPQFVMCIWSK